VIDGQQEIHVPEPAPTVRTCAWCPARATTEIELEAPRYTAITTSEGERKRVLRKPALTAPVCSVHNSSLERAA
jgi:hypothetical protein